MKYKITKSTINIPLIELNNYCISNGYELDVAKEEIVLFESGDKI